MDPNTIREAFQNYVLVGCGIGFLTMSVGGIVYGMARLPGRVGKSARKYGWGAVALFFGAAAWATVNAYPTREEKDEYEQEQQRQMAAERAWGETLGIGGVSPATQSLSADGADGSPHSPSGAESSTDDVPAGGVADGGPAEPVSEEFPSIRLPTMSDYEAGLVLTGIGTGETHDFTTPPSAESREDWRRFGANRDWFRKVFTNGWGFAFGTNRIDALTVFSYGTARPKTRDRTSFFSPLESNIGVAPGANWHTLTNGTESLYWQCLTPSNTFVMTWRNVLLDRLSDRSVSFQMEFEESGGVMFRYDLSELPDEVVSNLVVGVSNGEFARTFTKLDRNTTSLKWSRLTLDDLADPDRDGDGVPTVDELFGHHTNPDLADSDADGLADGEELRRGTNPLSRDSDGDGIVDGSDPDPAVQTSLADLDGDGIPDAYEDYWFSSTNAFNTATNRDDTGFTLDTKILGGINPTNQVAAANVVSTNSLVSWRLFDGLAADWPADAATNLVWERTFAVGRSSAWQQYFLSASPSNAAPWSLSGMRLEWETDTGSSGAAASSPFNDSLRIPLAADDMPATLTLRLRAGGPSAVLRSPSPLHLLAYAPEFRLEGGAKVTGDSGRTYTVFTEGSDSSIDLVIDAARRPHRAPAGADERDMGPFEDLPMQSGGCSFAGDETGGTVRAPRPGIYDFPDPSLSIRGPSPARAPRRAPRSGGGSLIVLDPSVGWGCSGHGCDSDGLGYDWEGDWYYEEDYYPLDSKCLRRKWYRDWGGGWYTGDCELSVASGIGEGRGGPVSTSVDGNVGSVYVDGVKVWSGTAEHIHSGDGGGDSREDVLADGCGSCDEDCANGNCDSLEGTTLGSLKFRIPLGAPVKGQVAGFVWFATEGPVSVSKSTFELLAHPDAHVTDSLSGPVRQIRCTDSRGRDLDLENIPDGVRITIREHATQTLEHTWEIVNVNGNASQVRLKKISRLNNVMSDETYTYAEGDWMRFDNIAGVGTQLTTYNDFADSGDGMKSETRTTTDAAGNVLSSVTIQKSRIGECDNAVIRETYREESTGLGWKWSSADYWNDPAHSARHGRPRLVQGNARAWVYTDYDENGHETLRVEQRGNAPVPSGFPYVVSNQLHNASSLVDAFVTVRDFAPLAGDSRHQDDAARPRIETRYVVTNGVAAIVGRTWTRYTRLNRDGYAAIKAETWRAGAQGAEVGDASNAYSYKITYADTGVGTPLLMRNAAAETLDENGVLTVNAYSLSDGVLSQTSRRFFQSQEFPTYETVELDASYGTVLRRTTRLTDGNTIIADEQSIYDSQNRLRSTTYLDGTSLTNAYSCCRLLWKRDREGRKTLRSAVTGTDHLYNAMEDVWLAGVSTNGQYRVTQHFYDALGRETNTVVYAGSTPGEATNSLASAGKALSPETTVYPDGDSDYAVHTDTRGRVTVRRADVLGDCVETGEAVFTNGVEVVKTKSRSYFGGGSSTRREWDGDRFTEERNFDDYLADGRRVAYVLTDSSDCGTVTNSVTTYDLLGRVASVDMPLGVTSNVYDGATSRVLSSVYTAGSVRRETLYLYNDFGEQVGTVLDGVTNRTDVAHELFSNVWWKVVREATIGPGTNALTVTCERLTGLSDDVRSQIIRKSLAGDREETLVSYDPDTGIETKTVDSSRAGRRVLESRHGIELASADASGVTTNRHDALGRRIRVEKGAVVREYAYDVAGSLVETRTPTATNVLVEAYRYDMLGRRIETVDALGQSTYKTYDPLGNVTAEWGAIYPVRYEYDTAGRRILLATTRDGVTWDETRWTYDASTGLCTSKTYADGSTVLYTHTPDGLPLRKTYAGGRWIENVYDIQRQIVGTLSSDGANDLTIRRDAYGRVAGETNAVASAVCSRADVGMATNEAAVVGGIARTLRRTVDGQGRLVSFGLDGGYAAQTVSYREDGRIGSISNADIVVDYAYSDDGYDIGYTLSVAGGAVFTRTLTRDPYRRELVLNIANSAGGNFAYAYDAISRPVTRNDDTFAYNNRGEVVSSRRGAENAETYSYDEIGNLLRASFNLTTNVYAANKLNQYTVIQECSAVSASLREPTYDMDGNMLSDGVCTYTYDSANRLVSVSSNGVLLATNYYDSRSRRVRKATSEATTTFFYDDWNLVEEHIAYTNGTTSTIHYYWGKDLSGTFQGAGGVAGLLYLMVDGAIYIPCYDNNGNVTRYVDANGITVATNVYDAFGRTISQSGPLADVFRHRFSSKYFDIETGLYYYGYRFYHPVLMRWLTRDPIEERGGLNFYSFVNNNPFNIDKLGLAVIVLKHLPGENPPGGWMSSNHAALTVYNSPFYFVTPQTCSDGRLRFSVSIEPPNSFVHVYFRSANDVVWAMRYETDHIDIVRQYDEALYAFKRAVESIYDCPRPAREKWIAEERKLRKIRDKLRLENDSYDEEGGPHDIMEK